MGLNDISDKFSKPVSQEKIHQEVISEWIKQLVIRKAGGQVPFPDSCKANNLAKGYTNERARRYGAGMTRSQHHHC